VKVGLKELELFFCFELLIWISNSDVTAKCNSLSSKEEDERVESLLVE